MTAQSKNGPPVMAGATKGSATMSEHAVRIFSAVGAGILIIGVVVLFIGVAIWQPLSTAPDLWTAATWVLLGGGLVLTILATSTLAARSRQH